MVRIVELTDGLYFDNPDVIALQHALYTLNAGCEHSEDVADLKQKFVERCEECMSAHRVQFEFEEEKI